MSDPRVDLDVEALITRQRPGFTLEQAFYTSPEIYTLDELLPIDPARDSYLLRVVGHSMIEDHIADGDLVMVDSTLSPRDGDIVVAVVDGEATLKRIYREADGQTIRLQPSNSAMEPIFVRPPQQLDLRGVVRGILRKF